MNIEKTLEFKCIAEKCLYSSDDYKIYGVSIDSNIYPEVELGKYGTASLVGDIQKLNIGTEYNVKAKGERGKYGTQYVVQNIKRLKPNSVESSKVFLYEIITPTQADTLLSVYPDIIDRIINNKLEDIDLNKTFNIKEYIFNVIKRKVIENFKLADVVDEFQGVFSISILKKLYEKYESVEKIKEVIRENPYKCLCGLSRVGFKTADALLLNADKISKENSFNDQKAALYFNYELKTSKQRMEACANYILDENENSGSTYQSVKSFKRQCEMLVKECNQHLSTILKEENNIYFDRGNLTIAKKDTHETELFIAHKLFEGLRNNSKWEFETNKYRKLNEFTLTDNQMGILEYMCNFNIVILNGFGGSGKSSSTKALINMLQDNKKSFVLFAPTGRAAKVLSGFTGEKAATIHRGLGCVPPSDWLFNNENPIFTDVVIVDEVSMVDIFLMKALLDAIDFTRTKLLMIGDDAQIPSVGAGNVLYDLLHSDFIPTVTLDKIFRYGEGGLMTVATDTRNSKEYLDKSKKGLQLFGIDKSYAFMQIKQENIVPYIVALYEKVLQQGYKKEDVMVLTSYNKGEYGTIVLNKKLQNVVNPVVGKVIKFGEIEYRLNDLVIQCKNDYKAIIYNKECLDEEDTTFIPNGEIGKIVKVEEQAIIIDFDGILIYCPKDKMSKIKLAYAISIHKSQGGQFKVVILVTPKAHTFMLNSNLLYVGETRAQEYCYHIGDIKAVNLALKKKENFDRKTFLCGMLQELKKEEKNNNVLQIKMTCN